MQVLNSGSFINLENQEKIEQLIFTAKEIARAAVETDGFNNEEENNKNFALEICQGAEYMCREHEEARIKNIFTNAFLEHLREIRRGDGGAPETSIEISEIVSQEIATDSVVESAATKDEFLGFVSLEEKDGISNSQEQSSIQDNTNQTRVDENEFFQREKESDENQVEKAEDTESAEPEQNLPIPLVKTEDAETEIASDEKADESQPEKTNVDVDGNSKTVTENALRLPEKEPYQFDKCTVTAMIQLLPANAGAARRKVVLSVRTHHFAPQISVVELKESDSVLGEILPTLEKSFEKYKADLPVKVMDKMKKEKSTAKKQSSKTAVETKANVAPNPTAGGQAKSDKTSVEAQISKPEETQSATTENTALPKTVVKPVESGQQGSLFGF